MHVFVGGDGPHKVDTANKTFLYFESELFRDNLEMSHYVFRMLLVTSSGSSWLLQKR